MAKRRRCLSSSTPMPPVPGGVATFSAFSAAISSPIHALDDGCLMHIISFLSTIPDRYNCALVCHRWCFLICHSRLWLRVERTINNEAEPGFFSSLEAAISAARPGETILVAPGGYHTACNIQIKKSLCIIGGRDLPDDTVLSCSRGSESALEFLSTCKITNMTIRPELGCCLLHRSGRLMIEGCILQCEENPLDYLSFPIITTANGCDAFHQSIRGNSNSVTVIRTGIKGGAKAVWTSGILEFWHVRAIYSKT